MRPSNAVRTVWNAGAIDTLHLGFRPIQKIATIHASSGFIRGIPSKDAPGHLRGRTMPTIAYPEKYKLGSVLWPLRKGVRSLLSHRPHAPHMGFLSARELPSYSPEGTSTHHSRTYSRGSDLRRRRLISQPIRSQV